MKQVANLSCFNLDPKADTLPLDHQNSATAMRFLLFVATSITLALSVQVEGYCEPSQACWPSQEEIEIFAVSLTVGLIQ